MALPSTETLVEPLLEWYDTHARSLPWRESDGRPWGVLVSEVMLQQTPVARVLPIWQEWMERWPTPSALAAEPAGEAVRAWGRLGYPRRALRLHAAASQITERHRGQVPSDLSELLALDGVGTYTAAAVATFAFGQRHAVVDTNVRRVQARAVTGVALPAPTLTAVEQRLARQLVPVEDVTAARWAIAVMELGALVCTARSPACQSCPIVKQCAWRLAGSPQYQGPARTGQTWHGTDRQVRGRLLAVLRATRQEQSAADLARGVPDNEQRDPGQRARCLTSLVVDGLAEQTSSGTYRLPQ